MIIDADCNEHHSETKYRHENHGTLNFADGDDDADGGEHVPTNADAEC